MWYVDLPDPNDFGNDNSTYAAVAQFETREEAIKFAQENFGANEEGQVDLVTGGDEAA